MQYKIIKFFLFFVVNLQATDLYFCTAADDTYFERLLNLIGSLHKTNFENLKEIAIFDLGLTSKQIDTLGKIEKTKLHQIELTNPDILKSFKINNSRSVKGWYAWKPVIIKHALDLFPYVLWIDSGITVLKNIDNLFKYIIQNGYFLKTLGDDVKNNHFVHSIKWQTTKYLIRKFEINSRQKEWILNQEAIDASIIGITKKSFNEFACQWYESTKDLKNFEDDGTTPEGFGTARHDQALLALIAYTKGLRILRTDYTQKVPIYLTIDNQEIPFYITWNSKYIDSNTDIYHSRTDISSYQEYLKYIRYKC